MNMKQFFYKNNRIHPLRGFIQVARTGNITEAARQLNLTQPAVSVQLQTLERDLGVRLFCKRQKKLALTEEGKELYEMAIPLIQDIDNLYERFLEKKKRKKRLTLDIAANHTSILYILPKLVERYKEILPDVTIMVRNISRTDAIEKLIDNQIHLAIYPVLQVPDECQFIHITGYDPILLTRKDHPLATKEEVSMEDIARYNMVRVDTPIVNLPLFEDTLKIFNIKSSIQFESADCEILKKFVRQGLGIAIMSDICHDDSDPLLTARTLPKHFPPMPYGALARKVSHHLPQVEAFLALLR